MNATRKAPTPPMSAPVTTKRCGRCDKVKPASDFWPDRKAVCGLQSWCKWCRGDAASLNPVIMLSDIRPQEQRRSERRAWILRQAMQVCQECGERVADVWPNAAYGDGLIRNLPRGERLMYARVRTVQHLRDPATYGNTRRPSFPEMADVLHAGRSWTQFIEWARTKTTASEAA